MADRQPTPPNEKRDVRIDFFRGIALYMILVDHVPGDPINKFTYTHLGFSDAAELFVFLSGISCAIVYSRLLARRGWPALLRAIAKRTAKIYAFYMVTSAIVIASISAAATVTPADFTRQPFVALTADSLSSLWSAALLTSPPALPGILVLYLMLTAIAIPSFLWLAQQDHRIALAVSAAVWALTQFDPDLAPRFAEQSYFDWLAWQFLFCVGMFVGLRRGLTSPVPASLHAWLLRIAWGIVIVSLGYRLALLASQHLHLNLEWLRLSDATVLHMKENLSPLRLVHFLSTTLLVVTYLKSTSALFENRGALAVIETGRFSLEVFCLSAIVDVLLNIWVILDQPSTAQRIVVDLAAIALIIAVVLGMAGRREHRRELSKISVAT
jgi:hypothetical protein